ncbi:MFS transporter [Xenorhabdus bovienii]|uniref:Putative transport protein (MFS family) n=1 Tax=Xenorhabdus bovienii str. Intermedium TaxID=1379677 RepID=A0A077QHE0_XENBV|nr:MFS transporter [Xenorhabdus bovienii]MDE9452297.1 MFS transporter [Xenorhabdus bovienii]MDE9480668.1 MFS transporter [Xenorhabdus bovienii]MDE9555844.1 MFS transporter [Xenorhabdus bovienii]MDE9563279.1 MFS transporter [Xenorhabdus bovienii]CDH32894.1 putative transport protein (MFS family) [Xenorhabdus bovienii str. Intermedium]
MNDNKMTPLELRATWGLGSVFSLRMLGMFMVLPVLTTYGLGLRGSSEALIGIAIGIYGLTQAIFQIPFGLLSDKIGRKPLIIGGLLIFVLGSITAALSDSIWGIIIGRALQGAGAISAAIMALLSDLTREQNRTKAMAFIGISFGITFAFAIVVGPIITHQVGLNGLFGIIAILASCGILITLFAVPPAHKHILNRESGIARGSFRRVLSDPQLLKLNFGILSLHTLLMSSFIALPLIMEKAGFPPQQHWKVYLITTLISFIAVLPFIIYAEKKRRMKQVFLLCIGLLFIAELVLWSVGSHLWGIFAGIQVFFLAFNIMEAILPSLISKEAPAGYKGTAMGVYSTSQFLGVALGGFLGGMLYELQGASLVFMGGIALTALWFIISLTLRQPPYVSSIRIVLPEQLNNPDILEKKILSQAGVKDIVIALEELSAYVKVDTKQTNREQLEQLVLSHK